jgi:hypothetical protein
MAVQSQSVTFTTSDAYKDITWVDNYTSFRLFFGVATTDSTTVAISLTNPSNATLPPTNTAVRVVPSGPFAGTVDVVCLEVV